MSDWRRVSDLVSSHKKARPEAGVRDVYKLLYQGVFGVGHIMGPEALPRLRAEIGGLDLKEQPNEPLSEAVSVTGSIVRVNLRPYVRAGKGADRLMDAMKGSVLAGKAEEYCAHWDSFAELVWAGKLGFDNSEVERINRELDREAPRPMHHTPAYREAYHPSYRVVRRRELLRILKE